jgi:GT2 family glycosyltransferase
LQLVVADNDSQNGSLECIKAWADGRLDTLLQSHGSSHHPLPAPVGERVRHVEYDRATAERGDGEATIPDVPLVLIQTGSNLGYAGGNNVALKYAFRRDPKAYALVLNNDHVILPKFLTLAMDSVLAGDAAGAAVLGFPSYSYDEPDRLIGTFIREEFTRGPVIVDKLPDVDPPVIKDVIVRGAAMLITPDAPLKLIPEDYFLYLEEVDYCKQIRQHGGTIAMQLDNPTYSLGKSKSVGLGSPLQIYYTRRNKLNYSKKYYSKAEYVFILTRMLYSTLKGYLRSTARGERMAARAYILSLLHHLQGKKGRTWVQH